MSKYLTRQNIADANDLPVVDLDLTEELGGFVKVRALNALERSEYQNTLFQRKGDDVQIDMKYAEVRLAALALLNEDETRMFEDVEEGVRELGKHSAKAIDKIVTKINELSALTPQQIKEMVEDLKATATSDSASA